MSGRWDMEISKPTNEDRELVRKGTLPRRSRRMYAPPSRTPSTKLHFGVSTPPTSLWSSTVWTRTRRDAEVGTARTFQDQDNSESRDGMSRTRTNHSQLEDGNECGGTTHTQRCRGRAGGRMRWSWEPRNVVGWNREAGMEGTRYAKTTSPHTKSALVPPLDENRTWKRGASCTGTWVSLMSQRRKEAANEKDGRGWWKVGGELRNLGRRAHCGRMAPARKYVRWESVDVAGGKKRVLRHRSRGTFDAATAAKIAPRK
ncbi:hypothetical protein C8R45DRAFT_937492 [Mycena sanguinolenta]|nr:hypothetical protein C8R45DRAFT_937492 [Mycena sanguinolenta]